MTAAGALRRISRQDTTMFFDPRQEPVAELRPGETVLVETADSVCGLVKAHAPAGFHIDEVVERLGGACPVTGPLHVAGAEPGAVLRVLVGAVRPSPERGQAWTGTFAGFGALTAERYSLDRPLPPSTTLVDYDRDAARLPVGDGHATIPLRPFLGTVGVAPRRERRMSFSQSPEYLGDVDLPALGPGAELVLPVHVPGALLCLGDAHGAQGDGEITGAAIEIEAEVELTCEVADRDAAGYVGLPQLNDERSIGSVAGLEGASLSDCARAAYRDLVVRISRGSGVPLTDAYRLVGQVGRLEVGNMMDPFASVRASVRRQYLPWSG